MKNNNRFIKKIGITLFAVTLILTAIPHHAIASTLSTVKTVSDLKTINLPIENKSSYHENESAWVASYLEYKTSSNKTPAKLVIEDVKIKNEVTYDTQFFKDNYDNILPLKIYAAASDGSVLDFYMGGNLKIALPSTWDKDNSKIVYLTNCSDESFFGRQLTETGTEHYSGMYNLETEGGKTYINYNWTSQNYGNKCENEVTFAELKKGHTVVGILDNKAVAVLAPPDSYDVIEIPDGVTEVKRSIIKGCDTGFNFGYWEPKRAKMKLPASVKTIDKMEYGNKNNCAEVWDEGNFICTPAFNFVFEVDDKNPYITDYDGAIYSKDLKTLICGQPEILFDPSGNYEVQGYRMISFPKELETITSYGMTGGCNNVLGDRILDSGTFYYGDYYGKEYYSFTVPDGVKTIGDHAFMECGFYEITIPKSVTSIGREAFSTHCFDEEYHMNPSKGLNHVGIVTVLNPNVKLEDRAIITKTLRGYKGSTAEAYVKKFNENRKEDDPFMVFEDVEAKPVTPDPKPDPDPQPEPSTGVLTEIAETTDDGTIDYVYRVYNRYTGEHFYTTDIKEKDFLERIDWTYEGISWSSSRGGKAVYRLYNPNNGDHHYTMNNGERSLLVRYGWKDEGLAFRSGSTLKAPVYRLYNPNQKGAGSHHFTKDAMERYMLTTLGWKDEGVAWYGK